MKGSCAARSGRRTGLRPASRASGSSAACPNWAGCRWRWRSPKATGRCFNELVDRYHELGYRRPVGCHLRYFIVAGDGRRLGCLLFQRASNRLRCRDEWIGWDGRRFNRRLERVVCNSRFLILPWVRVKNLASHALSLSAARLADDWQARWQVRPALVETFVDGRIREGTSYRAAGWEHAGRSAGDRSKGKAPKDVYLKALQADARAVLRHERRTPSRCARSWGSTPISSG